jgi:hypothetical protein
MPKRKKCKSCNRLKPLTQFSLVVAACNADDGKEIRRPTCRRCNYDGLFADERHKILREAYRNYLTWKDLITYQHEAETLDVISYRVPRNEESDEMVDVTISFHDLERALNQFNGELQQDGTVLSKRKEQAFYLNVIRDMLQRDVADIMGITTVSVGQYVEQGMYQLCDYYYAEDTSDTISDKESGA